jgi:hypothetical protein
MKPMLSEPSLDDEPLDDPYAVADDVDPHGGGAVVVPGLGPVVTCGGTGVGAVGAPLPVVGIGSSSEGKTTAGPQPTSAPSTPMSAPRHMPLILADLCRGGKPLGTGSVVGDGQLALA